MKSCNEASRPRRSGRYLKARCAIGLVVLLVFGQVAGAAGTASPIGVWANPKRTVNVRAEACGNRLCGTIVHATPAALDAARAKGVDTLVGTRVFQDMQPRGGQVWRGKLYVPDLGGRFGATMRLLDDDRLEVKGCILGGLICKSQIWTRVAASG